MARRSFRKRTYRRKPRRRTLRRRTNRRRPVRRRRSSRRRYRGGGEECEEKPPAPLTYGNEIFFKIEAKKKMKKFTKDINNPPFLPKLEMFINSGNADKDKAYKYVYWFAKCNRFDEV